MKPLLEQLRKLPNVSVACERVEVSRNTFYKWCMSDPEFKKEVDVALDSGIESINDLAESKLIGLINNGNQRAVEYWLNNHKKAYIKPRDKNFWVVDNKPRQIAKINVVSLRDVLGDQAVDEINGDSQ
jgi:hypothetical protein